MEQPEIKVNPKPGKVFASVISIDLNSKSKNDSKSQNIKSTSKIKKSSSQSIEDNYSVNYRTPYIDSETVKMFYEQNPYHFRCVNLKALAVAGIGYDILPVDSNIIDYMSDEQYKRIDSFLRSQINDAGESFEDILIAYANDYFNFGNSYMEIVLNNSGELAELYNLRAYNTRIAYDNRYSKFSDAIKFIQLSSTKEAKEFKLINSVKEKNINEILWHKNYNPFDKFYGFPEWYSATGDLALDRAAVEYNIKSFQNDLMISFAIIVEGGELDEEAMSKIKEFLSANYKGVANSSKALYLNSDSPDVKIRIERVQKDVRETSFTKTREQARDSIIIAHGVLGTLLGIKTPGQLGGTNEADTLFRVFNETIIKPEKRKLQNKFNFLFKTKFGIDKFYLELKELSYETLTEMINYVKELSPIGVIDTNEARDYLGYEPKEENTTEEKINKALSLIKSAKKELTN